MNDEIDLIKKKGAERGLIDSIDNSLYYLKTGIFGDIKNGNHYKCLGRSIERARLELDKIENRLKALNESDGKSV